MRRPHRLVPLAAVLIAWIVGGAASLAEPPQPLTERGLANLEALTRVVGYVRHYSPADEAAGVDWDRFVVDAIARIEPAATAEELAAALKGMFTPIAPAASFSAGSFDGPFDPAVMLGTLAHESGTIRWTHRGFAPNAKKAGAIYWSERLRVARGEEVPEGVPDIGECVTERLRLPGAGQGEAIWVRVPIVLYTDEQGTLPHPVTSYIVAPDALDLSADSRAVRLAGVMIAWNVLQHHFPYFDVIHDDWNAALREALRSAATDADAAAFQLTLERLTSHLHDGHGNVVSRELMGKPVFSLPLLLTFVGDQPVVLNAIGDAVPKGVHPGDVVLSIGGMPIAALIEEAGAHEPAATEGYFKVRAARRIVRRSAADPVEVVFRAPSGDEHKASLKPVAFDRIPPERSGPIVSEPRPGVWYVDLDRATDKDIAAAMPNLVKATGVIFDMRGYPNGISMGMLGHLSEQRVSCARWEIPIANWPDRRNLVFDHARWDLPPLTPRITAKTAFITDGRAISAAETFLGIVEAYKLAEIVGEPTAGTNGNVNVINLPGGFSISFTGMKVLKHDGSQHHGVGILPTVTAHRTIEGIAAARDEMLEKAIEAVLRR